MPDVQLSTVPEKAARKKRKWPAVVLVLVLAATGIFLWLREPSTAAEGAAESTLTLETFVVNLTASGPRAYLRAGITLG